MELEKRDESQIHFLEGLLAYLDMNNNGDLKIIKLFDNIARKYDYNSEAMKLAFTMAQSGKAGSFRINNKTYRLSEPNIRFLLGTHIKKEGGFLPLLPLLLGLGAAGATALAAKRIHDNRQQLEELKAKSGGILPLLALLPLIFGGIAAAGGVAGGAAGIAKAVSDKKAADEAAARDAEYKRQQITQDAQFKQKLIDTLDNSSATPESKAKALTKLAELDKSGSGIVADKLQEFGNTLEGVGAKIKGFFDGIGDRFRAPVQKIFQKLGKDFNIEEKQDGQGLYLTMRPKQGSGIFLPTSFSGNGIYLGRGRGLILPKTAL